MDTNTSSTEASTPTHNATVEALFHLIDEIVAVHLRVQMVAEELHGHSELSRVCRRILRDLHRMGPRTVPQLARGRPVSRPNVLMLVNRLVAQNLVQTLPNPDHKRSYLVCLSAEGTALFEAMERRERDVLAQMDLDVSLDEIQRTSHLLERLQEKLLRWQRDQ